MISEPKIEISDTLTGSQASLQQGGMLSQNSLNMLISQANCIPVDSTSVITLAVPRLLYTQADHLQQPDELNGLIIYSCHSDKNAQTGLSEKSVKPSDTEKCQAQLRAIMAEQYSWIPLIESEQLTCSIQRENFIVCVLALHELNQLRTEKLTRHALIDFHSRYKLVLLAHSQPGYREIGPFVAQVHQWQNLDEFFIEYRKKLMAILKQPASCENHVNVMMHIQGYFTHQQTAEQRSEICRLIHDYRVGNIALSVPLTRLKQYLSEYPNSYLLTQKYFNLYPKNLD